MILTLTKNAAQHIQKQIASCGHGIALRIGIKKSGCSGYSYTYDLADEIKDGDQLFTSNNAKIIVNINDLPYLNGTQIDFVQDGLNSFYKLTNPNIDNTCGCGDSFNFKQSTEA